LQASWQQIGNDDKSNHRIKFYKIRNKYGRNTIGHEIHNLDRSWMLKMKDGDVFCFKTLHECRKKLDSEIARLRDIEITLLRNIYNI
jgi:hypothetical protein